MRRLSLAALLAAPLLLVGPGGATANPIESRGFGCGGYCLGMFSNIHQHGPLFNYGPYYGYYPFKPYGPWDAYLRYDPFFYGDPYANWNAADSNMYGRNPHFPYLRGLLHVPHIGLLHHGCHSCGFWHASWLHGGWFRGHAWLHGGFGHKHHSGCSTCGGLAEVAPAAPGDPVARYSGIGDPSQSTIFYAATPTLNPAADLPPAK